jgi:hypothetical protein
MGVSLKLGLVGYGLGLFFVVGACSVDDRKPDVGVELTRSLTFGVQATPRVTSLPAGVGSGPQVVDLPQNTVAPTVVRPGESVNLAVGWEGGAIASVNLSFTQNQYFSIPAPLAEGSSSGIVEIPASVAETVCRALDPVCHALQCFQQVVSADGTVSLARTIAMILDCGGTGCGETGMGTIPAGDPCEATMECVPGSVCFNKYCVGAGNVRISLGFSVDSDFDLHVLTPGGLEIYFGDKEGGGGTLDVDQCVSSCGTDPHVENVVFDGDVVPGVYEIWVENFDGRDTGDFTIQIAGDVTQTFSGTLPATRGAESEHFTFTL